MACNSRGVYTWSKNLDEVNGEGGTDVYELQLPTNDQHNLRQSYAWRATTGISVR